MAKKLYIVRVVISNIDVNVQLLAQPLNGGLLDNLQYTGVINIFPPESLWAESKTWAETTSKRMMSFGYNAVSALYTGDLIQKYADEPNKDSMHPEGF